MSYGINIINIKVEIKKKILVGAECNVLQKEIASKIKIGWLLSLKININFFFFGVMKMILNNLWTYSRL